MKERLEKIIKEIGEKEFINLLEIMGYKLFDKKKFLERNNKMVLQEKFIVVNKEQLSTKELFELTKLLGLFHLRKNRYYVCNRDEPYANQVIKVITEGEDRKINLSASIQERKKR